MEFFIRKKFGAIQSRIFSTDMRKLRLREKCYGLYLDVLSKPYMLIGEAFGGDWIMQT